MNEEQLKALAAGVPMQAVLAMATKPAESTEPAQDAAAIAAAAATAAAAAAAAAQNATSPAPTVEGLQAKLAETQAEASGLQVQLKAQTEALASAKAEIDGIKAQLLAQGATLASATAALGTYTTKMAVALDKHVDITKMSAAEVIQAHAKMAEDFAANFKPGRQSASAAKTEPAQNQTSANLMAKAQQFKL